ncbi:MAG: rhodanese-like domain-containing protein, partial [Acidobacteriota bacterium]
MSKEEFVKIVAADQPEAPAYFPKSAAKNLEGSAALTELAKPVERSYDEIRAFDGVVIDVRQASEYGAGHVSNSVNIGLGGQFASWAGILIPIGTTIAIAADNETQVEEAVTRLSRVGHESVTGYILSHNFDGETKTIEQAAVEMVRDQAKAGTSMQLVDVRRSPEYVASHASGSVNIPLDKLAAEFDRLDPSVPTYVICQSGYRSSIGTGILENAGFTNVYNVKGGTAAWVAAGLDTETSATACAGTT